MNAKKWVHACEGHDQRIISGPTPCFCHVSGVSVRNRGKSGSIPRLIQGVTEATSTSVSQCLK